MTYDETVETLACSIFEEFILGRSEAKAIIQDALSAIKPGMELGNGLVAVPKEPTKEMYDAFDGNVSYWLDRYAYGTGEDECGLDSDSFGDGYRAMVAAAKGEDL